MNSPESPETPFAGPRAKSLRRTHYLVFGGLIVLTLLQLFLSLRRHLLERDLTASQQNRQRVLRIADELRRNWDDLVRMARSFVATGNPAYEQYYNQILAIRDGQKPRPADYDKVYWDLVIALGHQPPAAGPAISMDSRIKSAGFTRAEIARVEESNRQSGHLLLLTRLAMNAARGIYRDATGRFSLPGTPDRANATRVLNGPEFHQAKARVMKPILDLQVMLDNRTRAEFQRFQAASIYNARLETGLIALAVLLLITSFVVLNRTIFEPIAQLAASAAAVGRNGFFRRVLVTRDDELGRLAGALNRMSETVEQKIAESAAAEERFRSLIESAPDAVIISDAESQIRQVNRQAESLLGYSREELIGQPLTLVLPPAVAEDAPPATEPADAAQRGFAETTGCRTALRKDGTGLSVDINVRPMKAADGGQLVCHTLRDVTDRQVAAAEVNRILAFRSVLLDTIPYPMFIQDSQARFVSCNQEYERAFGVTREELKGRTLTDLLFIPEPARARLQEEIAESIRTATRSDGELSVLFQDQTERPVLYTIGGFRLPDESSGGLIGLLVDVSGQRRAADELNNVRRLFQTVIDNSSSLVYVKDTQGRYVFTNRNYEKLWGRAAGSLIGLTAVEALGREHGRASDETDREVRRTRELHVREEITEINGERRTFTSQIFALANDQGELVGTAGIADDITEVSSLRQELASTNEALRRQLDSPAETTIPGPSGSELEFAGKHVLVAQDDEAGRETIAQVLGVAGITHDIARSGSEAVGRIKDLLYDAILLDVQVPEMNGLELTRFIREQLGDRSLPVIGLTTNASPDELEACKRAGMDDYLTLPVDQKLLLRVLRKWLKPHPEKDHPEQDPRSGGSDKSESVFAVPENPTEGSPQDSASGNPTMPDSSTGEAERASVESIGPEVPASTTPADDQPGHLEANAAIHFSNVASLIATPDISNPTVEPVSFSESDLQQKEPAVAETASPAAEDSEPPKPSIDSARGEEPKPARKKRFPRKRKSKPESQSELFGDYDGSGDEAGPVRVMIDSDGVPTIPGIDLRDAMNRLDLPIIEVREVAIQFARDLAQTFAGLRAALESQDHATARRHAHSLAGAAGNLSADTIRRLAKTLELALKFEQGDYSKMLNDLEHEAARITEGIRQLEAMDPAPSSGPAPAKTRPSPATRKLQTVLDELAAALEEGEIDAISHAVGNLKKHQLPKDIQPSYDRLSELVDGFDYAEAVEVVRSIQARVG